MRKTHTNINRLILDSKDVSMFPITRTVLGSKKVWAVTDQRDPANHKTFYYSTKFAAEEAICFVVKRAMK